MQRREGQRRLSCERASRSRRSYGRSTSEGFRKGKYMHAQNHKIIVLSPRNCLLYVGTSIKISKRLTSNNYCKIYEAALIIAVLFVTCMPVHVPTCLPGPSAPGAGETAVE